MIRLLKLLILAAVLAVPFLGGEARLAPGTRAFATGGSYRTGAKLTVVSDDGSGPDRRVAVRTEAGQVGLIARNNLHPIDFTVRR